MIFRFLISLIGISSFVSSKLVVELQSLNFELTVTSYSYLAILFYDPTNDVGLQYKSTWAEAVSLIENHTICDDCEVAMINGLDPDLKEVVDAYMLKVPCVRVFRRGVMGDYRGPSLEPSEKEAVASYLKQDSLPSVQVVKSLLDIKSKLKQNAQGPGKTVVLGFFNINEDQAYGFDETTTIEGYSNDPWGQFQASADFLRGHATFFGLLPDPELLSSFNVELSDLPVLYLVSDRGDSLIPFPGEVIESSITEWVLRHSTPITDELSFTRPSGELYFTQFFSSKKLKFILFLPTGLDPSKSKRVIDSWRELSELFRSEALFSYMIGGSVPDVLDFFAIDEKRDFPLLVAHDPSKDYKYVSESQISINGADLEAFVSGVLAGKIERVLKSEVLSRKRTGSSLVERTVGKSVVESVSRPDKDVLLFIYAPWCVNCKKLMPTMDILAKAVAAEDRIAIVKIDGTANDLPLSWNAKTFPMLLWFPAKDKPYRERGPLPRSYWDAGNSLMDLVSFIQRHSSFESKTLRIATSEQLGSLLGDEAVLREKYEIEDRHQQRNEDRVVFENEAMDWLLGEVVFDGRRWHILAAVIELLVILLLLGYTVSVSIGSKKLKKKIA